MFVYFFVYFFLAATANHNNPLNNSDVVVTYGGHADAVQPVEVVKGYPAMTSAQPALQVISEAPAPELLHQSQPPKPCLKSSGCGDSTEPNSLQPSDHLVTDSVDMVFIPNEHVSDDSSEFLNNGGLNNLGAVMEGRYRISDIVNGRALENTEPSIRPEVLFVTGKNFEIAEESREHPTRRHQKHQEGSRTKEKTPPKKKVDCKKLDCSNKIESVCGGKVENVNKWKYRLFLNQCYFDKVNCEFKFDYNKYTIVPREKCDKFAAHYTRRPSAYRPRPPAPKKVPTVDEMVLRRSMSRRATNMDTNGQYCSHPCPTSCPSDYNPECGVSASGQKRVFLNHCKLDYNSCSFRIVWFRRPLAECVGQEAVDLKQNRPFISWMQHIGIIDARGRFIRE